MNKSTLTTILIFLTLNICSAQNNLSQTLWYASMVHDTLGNAYPNQNIERFMFFENGSNISTLSIDQKTSMSNGETIISYTVEANNLAKKDIRTFKVKEYKVDNFEIVNKDSIYYREKGYHVGFKRLKTERSNRAQSKYLEFLLNNRVRQYYGNGENLNQLHVYKNDGTKEIDVVDSKSSWESPYRLISFEGFVFLRGITSYPIVLLDLNEKMITGLEIDRKSSPLTTEIRKE